MTDEQRAAQIQALIEERRGYETRGLKDRVAQVDAQLRILGAQGSTAASRASRRDDVDVTAMPKRKRKAKS
jgi:hypothetical protein